MRYRKPNEKAVRKLLNYLNALQSKCDGTDFTEYTTSQLHITFQVSKSTFSVCKKLDIVKDLKGVLHWEKENPNREMALQILGVLLEQSKKEIVTPISSDWTALAEILGDISEKLSIGLSQQKNVLNRPVSPQKEQSLFSDQEKTAQLRHELITSIATGIYKDFETLNSYEAFNHRIIAVADHLLSLYHKK